MKLWPVILALASWACAAQASTALSLDELLIAVKRRHPLVLSQQSEKQVAEGDLQANEGAFDFQWKSKLTRSGGFYANDRIDSLIEKPTTLWGTTFSAGYRYGQGKFALYDGKQETLTGGEWRAGIDIPLWRNGATDRRRANVERSVHSLTVAEAQITQTLVEQVRQATQRYWDWVVAGQKVKLYRGLLKAAADRDSGIGERVKHGDLPKFERQDNERTILQRQAQLIAAERQLQQAAIELSLFWRNAEGTPVQPVVEQLPAELPRPTVPVFADAADSAAVALQQRPEILRFQALQKQNDVERDLFDNQLAPRIDLQFALSRDMGAGDPSRRSTETESALVLEIPLERNVAQGRVSSANANREKIELLARLQRERILADIQDVQSNLQAAFLRWELNHREWTLAQELEQGERMRFQQGDSNIFMVNQREQATADAAVRELDSANECHRGAAAWKAVLGGY